MEVGSDSVAEQFRKFIEIEILKAIQHSLETGNTTVSRAAEIARRVLELMPPGQAIKQSYMAALELVSTFNELIPAMPAVIKEYKSKYANPDSSSSANMVATETNNY